MTDTIREMPKTKHDFLRWQVGTEETRPEEIPILDRERIVGYRQGSNLVGVFRLLGWGATLEEAQKMVSGDEGQRPAKNKKDERP